MADYGEMMDSGARSARRTILIPKCSNEDDEVMQDGDFLFIISKVLTKNNQRRREKTTLSREVVFSYLRNRSSDPEHEGDNERKVSESRQDDERGEL